MSSLKFSIIWLGIGGALLVALVTTPLLLRLPALGLATVAAAWIGGWGATRLLQPAVLGVTLPAVLTIGLLAGLACACAGLPISRGMVALRSGMFAGRPGFAAKLKPLYRALGVIACFAIGYGTHRLFQSSYPALHLLLALGLWLLLWRALPALGGLTCGLLAGAVYVASASMPFAPMVYLPKGQQVFLAGAAIAVAIFRDDTRIYRALPLLLLFDMQSAAQLCMLIIVAEVLTAAFRGKGFAAIVPAALTAAAAALIMFFTTVYAQKNSLFDLRVVAAVLASSDLDGVGRCGDRSDLDRCG